MQNRFFTQAEFNKNFGKEMASAVDVYEQRKKSGLDDYSLATYDFIFISDTKDKLVLLSEFLKTNYGYKINEISNQGDYWELTGDTTEFPVDESNLMYWALDLCCKGFEFDCKLDGYGASGDPENQIFLELDFVPGDYYFDKAMEAYNNRNLGMAFVYFSLEIKINPNDPNAWYSRAIIRDELYTWKAARRDYDKAIELAPDFIDAIVNRATNKDEAGEHKEAIEDYTKVLELDPQNAMAYLNRGNSKLNINDKKGACADWAEAKALGDDLAQRMIDENCK
jgi:tetratricopeptide (TPR) repeat protein